MANTLSFVVSSITQDRTQGILTDSTTYGSPARAATGLFVKGYKMNHNSTVASTLTVLGNDGDPETDTYYTFNIPSDGWIRFNVVSIPDFDTNLTYAQYDAVFNPSDNKVYRSLQAGNTENDLTNTTWWEEIATADIADLAANEGEDNESANIDSLVYEPGVFPNSQYAFANQISEASEEYLTSLNLPDDDLNTYSLMALMIDGMQVNADRSEMSAVERKVRRFDSLVESIQAQS